MTITLSDKKCNITKVTIIDSKNWYKELKLVFPIIKGCIHLAFESCGIINDDYNILNILSKYNVTIFDLINTELMSGSELIHSIIYDKNVKLKDIHLENNNFKDVDNLRKELKYRTGYSYYIF